MAEFSSNAAQRIARATVQVERRMRNTTPRRARWFGNTGGLRDRHFELKDDHDPGDTSTAYWQEWDSGDSEWDTTADTDHEFEVTDRLEIFRGRKRAKYSSPHDDGSKGVARYCQESGEWEIIRLQPAALLITGLLTAALETTDSTFTIDGVTVMNPTGGLITDQDPAGNITVYNVHDWEGDNNGRVDAAWNETTEHWEAIQVDCPA